MKAPVLPEGMTPEYARALRRLSAEEVHRVMERAAIIHEACGVSWREADERALREDGPQRSMWSGK